MLIDLSTIQVIPLAEYDLEKAAFKHGYYTHLVPKKITGKDGVPRIYWVNPDPGKKTKLTRITHFREGKEAEHHKEIKEDHVIEEKDLIRLSEGDKVAVTYGAGKGQEGVLRGALAGPSPRVSVAFLNPKTGKYESKTMNVNHLKLVHRASDDTKKVVERKTVEVTNIKGETILVDRNDFEKYYKDREKAKTPQQKVTEEAGRITMGGVYERADGHIIHITKSKKMGGVTSYEIQAVNPIKKSVRVFRDVEETKLKTLISDHKYARIPRPTILKAGKIWDPSDKAWKKWVTEKPKSADLENGEMHKAGRFPYDATGYRVAVKDDEMVAREILAEHWPTLEGVVKSEVGKFSAVTEDEVTAADIIEPLTRAVITYEPLLDTGSGIEGRLVIFARAYSRNAAEKIHEREKSTIRDDFVSDDTVPASGAPAAVDKKAIEEFLQGDASDIIASAFVSKQDAMLLKEGLDDEADLMSWLYGDEKILDIMKRWTGLGVFEPTLNKKEAAAELTGLAYNPVTMEPYKTSTIETSLLPKEYDRIVEAFKTEGADYPDFKATLKKDLNLRNKLQRNRKLLAVHPKDEKVIKVVREAVKTPDHRAKFAADLIGLGVPAKDVAPVMQLGDRILAGVSTPDDYATQLPRHLWANGSKALTAWFKKVMPPSVFAGKRAAALNLPRRFDVEGPINRAIANERKNKLEYQQATARQLAAMGKEPPESWKPVRDAKVKI